MNENMKVWEAVCTPPAWALKKIAAGRMAGKTDINPQWRIKALTEQFGMCGVGWKIEIVKKWTKPGAQGEVMCFVDLNLFIRTGVNSLDNAIWSEPIPGSGGSMLVASESKGLRASDEGYKMATTDAISVACKMIGVAADIYQGEEYSKYNQTHPDPKGDKEKEDADRIALEAKDESMVYTWLAKAMTLDHVTAIKSKLHQATFSIESEKRVLAAIACRESEITASACASLGGNQ